MTTALKLINEFISKELIPMEQQFLIKEFKELLPDLRKKREMVKQMGLWGPNYPEELGGMGLSMVEHGLVSEALGKESYWSLCIWMSGTRCWKYRNFAYVWK